MKTWAKGLLFIIMIFISTVNVFAETSKTVDKEAVLNAIVGYNQKLIMIRKLKSHTLIVLI